MNDTADTVADRVQRGVAWLDANGPADWPDRVNLNDFDMADECRCVLGWTFGSFDAGVTRAMRVEKLGVNERHRFEHTWAFDHGFDADEFTSRDEFRRLQARWTRIVKRRQRVWV